MTELIGRKQYAEAWAVVVDDDVEYFYDDEGDEDRAQAELHVHEYAQSVGGKLYRVNLETQILSATEVDLDT